MKTLDKIYIGAMIRANVAKDKLKEFLEAQDGVSNVAASVVLVLVAVLLIQIFHEGLQDWIEKLMDKIFKIY